MFSKHWAQAGAGLVGCVGSFFTKSGLRWMGAASPLIVLIIKFRSSWLQGAGRELDQADLIDVMSFLTGNAVTIFFHELLHPYDDYDAIDGIIMACGLIGLAQMLVNDDQEDIMVGDVLTFSI